MYIQNHVKIYTYSSKTSGYSLQLSVTSTFMAILIFGLMTATSQSKHQVAEQREANIITSTGQDNQHLLCP